MCAGSRLTDVDMANRKVWVDLILSVYPMRKMAKNPNDGTFSGLLATGLCVTPKTVVTFSDFFLGVGGKQASMRSLTHAVNRELT